MTQYLGGTQQIQYGTSAIVYELMYVERDDLAIHVYPDGSVVVEAPPDTGLDIIESRVYKRAKWILKQQRTFSEYSAPDPNRMYVSGETYFYLGKRYRLKLIPSDFDRVKFNRGRIYLYVTDTRDWQLKSRLIQKWYRTRAKFIFEQQLEHCFKRFSGYDIAYPELQIRAMKSQWGSCTASGKIMLNLKLIKVKKKLIDYVIVHELCHLIEHNHSQKFYELLSLMMPDWEALRKELNQLELV